MLDKDLASIQETRDLLRKASAAQKELAKMTQEKLTAFAKLSLKRDLIIVKSWLNRLLKKQVLASGRIKLLKMNLLQNGSLKQLRI